MSTAAKPKPEIKGEYVYGYAIACEGDFYDGSGEFVNLEEARIYSEAELSDLKKIMKEAAEETGADVDDLEKVVIVIREA